MARRRCSNRIEHRCRPAAAVRGGRQAADRVRRVDGAV